MVCIGLILGVTNGQKVKGLYPVSSPSSVRRYRELDIAHDGAGLAVRWGACAVF